MQSDNSRFLGIRENSVSCDDKTAVVKLSVFILNKKRRERVVIMRKQEKLARITGLALAACVLLTSCSGGGKKAAASPAGSALIDASKISADNSSGHLIAAADPSKLPAAAAARKNTLVIGVDKMNGVFNLLYTDSEEDAYVGYSISMALSDNDAKGEITDGMASVAASSDGLTYTYKLKPNKYSDGSPIKAEDYVNYFKVLFDKSYDGPGDPSAISIAGAKEYTSGKAKNIAGIKAPDDRTLQIKLNKPNSSAEYFLGGAFPISTKLYGKLIRQGNMSAFKNLSMINFVGNGPYILTDYKPGQTATLKANPYYYKGKPKIPNLIYKMVPEGEELQTVTTGQVDIEPEIHCSPDQIAIGKKAGFVNMWIQPALGYSYIAVNTKKPLFHDLKVRQALLYAFNRKAFLKSVSGDYATALNCNQTKISWVYSDKGLNPYPYNPAKAAELLKEDGWTKNSSGILTKNGKPFQFTFSAVKGLSTTDAMIPMMIDAYKKLGITMDAEYVDWPTLLKKDNSMKFDMLSMAWALTADPNDSPIYKTGGAQNYSGYSNPTIDKAYDEALAAQSREQIKAAYHKVYKLINENLPCLFLDQGSNCIAYNSRVKNFKTSPYCPIWDYISQYELQ